MTEVRWAIWIILGIEYVASLNLPSDVEGWRKAAVLLFFLFDLFGVECIWKITRGED